MCYLSSQQGAWPTQAFPHGCFFLKAHFCGLLVAHQLLVNKLAPICRGQGEREDRADHSRLVDGRFNKQGALHVRLFLGGDKMSRSPDLSTRILKDFEALPGLSYIYDPDGLNNALFPQSYILELALAMGKVAGAYIPRQGARCGASSHSGSALRSASSHNLSTTSFNKYDIMT